VHVEGTELDSIGMLVDFKKLKEILKGITEEFDHTFLNEHEAFNGKNPTAENIARYIYQVYAEKLRAENPSVRLSDVRVWESPGSSVTYRED
jgi:6-pyruvoyltetrahydropterin/6-carboxytetrahydropterin synthase